MGVFGFDHKKRESLVKKKGEIGQKKTKGEKGRTISICWLKRRGEKKYFFLFGLLQKWRENKTSYSGKYCIKINILIII